MKHYVLILFIGLAQMVAYSQSMEIQTFETLSTDISARTNPCFDLNGDPCALIKVDFAAPNATFEGNVVKVIPKEGQYWVYLVSGSRSLTIKHSNLLPCKIMFDNYQVNKLDEKTTYGLTLAIPEQYYSLIINSAEPTNQENADVYKEYVPDSIATVLQLLFDSGEYDRAFPLAQDLAEQRDALACHLLAMMYYQGKGTEPDCYKGHQYSGYAAQKGNYKAQYNYALDLLAGTGCKPDQEEALKWLEISAQNNFAPAQRELGLIYRDGTNVIDPDLTKSFKWTRNAAEQGDAVAQEELGYKYADGIGVAKNPQKAMMWFMRAAESGKPSAYCNIGILFRDGEGVNVDYTKAKEFFEKGYELGDVYSMFLLGDLYEWFIRDGNGAKALNWYIKASEMGSRKATNRLIKAYEQGDYFMGVSKNSQTANTYKSKLNSCKFE